MTDAATPDIDPKRARVLEGAMKVFLAYGYARTTMDDIARAADMSRPALYLLFRNKADIYRAIAVSVLSRSAQHAGKVLGADGPFFERMMLAVEGSLIDLMREVMASPHGAEILDMKTSLAADLACNWHDGLVGHFTAAIAREAAGNGVDPATRGFSAEQLADFLLDGLEGMKARSSDPDRQAEMAAALIRVVERAVQP